MRLEPEILFEDNEFFKSLKLRYEIGHQTIFLTTGGTNSGKTVFNVFLYYLIKKGILKEKINLDNCKMHYSIIDFAKNITKVKNEIIFYDEAGTELDIGSWNGVFNKTMRHILQTQRVKRNFYFILLPHIRHISYVLLPLFTFHIVMETFTIYNKKTDKLEVERVANIYKIISRQTYSASRDYQDMELILRMKVPDIRKIENRDFQELYKKFHEMELKKKNDIALKIEEETNDYLLKEKTNEMKIKRMYEQEKMKCEKLKEDKLKKSRQKKIPPVKKAIEQVSIIQKSAPVNFKRKSGEKISFPATKIVKKKVKNVKQKRKD